MNDGISLWPQHIIHNLDLIQASPIIKMLASKKKHNPFAQSCIGKGNANHKQVRST
jgi:hypothetical protein